MTRALAATVLAVATSTLARPASAGEIAVGLEGGYATLTNAQKSAKAVFDGSSGGPTFGGSVRLGLGRSLFAGVGGRFFSKDGERAFVASAGSPAFGLGHPLKVRVVPVHALVGYRFRPDARFVPYAGLGGGVTSYHEESTVGGIAEPTVSLTKASGLVLAGVEYGHGTVRFGAEVQYLLAPKTLGLGGVSDVYGEDDVGGFTALARIVFVP